MSRFTKLTIIGVIAVVAIAVIPTDLNVWRCYLDSYYFRCSPAGAIFSLIHFGHLAAVFLSKNLSLAFATIVVIIGAIIAAARWDSRRQQVR